MSSCSLEPDLEVLPDGEETEIREKGIITAVLVFLDVFQILELYAIVCNKYSWDESGDANMPSHSSKSPPRRDVRVLRRPLEEVLRPVLLIT